MSVLKNVIEEIEAELKTAANAEEKEVTVHFWMLDDLVCAAKLFLKIYGMADKGELDGVYLDWMCEADELVMGDQQ
jgi:hypothetical protein